MQWRFPFCRVRQCMEALSPLDPRQQCSMDPGLHQGLRRGSGATRPMHPTQVQPGVAPWAEVGAAARPGAAPEMGQEAAAALAEGLGDSHRAEAEAGWCHTMTMYCQIMLLLLSPQLL